MFRFLSLIIVVTIFFCGQPAQTQPQNLPLSIDAEQGIEWYPQEKAYIAKGNVIAKHDIYTLHADELKAYYRSAENDMGTEVWRIEAIGSVTISSPQETLQGMHAIYELDRQVFLITGDDIRLIRPEQTIIAHESMEYWQNENKAILRGKAEIIDAEHHIRANILVGYFENQNKTTNDQPQLKRVEAFQNVLITTQDRIIAADKGVYDVGEERAQLFGNVKLTQNGNHIEGDKLETNLKSGVSHLTKSEPSSPQRVQGILHNHDTKK